MDYIKVQLVFPVRLVEPISCPNEAVMKCTAFDPLGKPKNATAVLRRTLAARDVLESYNRCLQTYIPKRNLPKMKYSNVAITIGVYLLTANNANRSLEITLPLLKEAIYDYIGLDLQQVITEHCFKRFISAMPTRNADEYVFFALQNDSKSNSELYVSEQEISEQIGVSTA